MSKPTHYLNDDFLKALKREPVSRTPVWLMRQAGRYLPSYLATRAKAGSFMALATNPQLATEVTMQPIDQFDLDAAILFSDILTIPDAMGLGLSFATGEGPQFAHPLQDEASINQLQKADLNQLKYVFDAVKSIKQALQTPEGQRVPLIGFSGSPWTLACYMIDGHGGDFAKTRAMLYSRPDLLQKVLAVTTHSVVDYLIEQAKAGADALMIFDTWGGLLPFDKYKSFSLSYMTHIVKQVKSFNEQIPLILFTKGGGLWLEEMVESGADALGIDWTVDINHARRQVGHQVALQGNCDPMLLLSRNESLIREEVRRIKNAFGSHPGHVFNLGHGITPKAYVESVAVLIDEVHSNLYVESDFANP